MPHADRLARPFDSPRFARRAWHLVTFFGTVACLSLAVSAAPVHRELSFAIANGVVAGVPADTVSVQQGDDLVLQWTSDKPIELHLHGYDIERKVAPQSPAVMSFKASIPGRFPIEQHGQGPGKHKPLLYLEVHP